MPKFIIVFDKPENNNEAKFIIWELETGTQEHILEYRTQEVRPYNNNLGMLTPQEKMYR